jgi:hypothetical protein
MKGEAGFPQVICASPFLPYEPYKFPLPTDFFLSHPAGLFCTNGCKAILETSIRIDPQANCGGARKEPLRRGRPQRNCVGVNTR